MVRSVPCMNEALSSPMPGTRLVNPPGWAARASCERDGTSQPRASWWPARRKESARGFTNETLGPRADSVRYVGAGRLHLERGKETSVKGRQPPEGFPPQALWRVLHRPAQPGRRIWPPTELHRDPRVPPRGGKRGEPR